MYNIANGGAYCMKKVITSILGVILLLSIFTGCESNTNSKDISISKSKEEKIIIDKSNLDSYSTTLLKSINYSYKKQKELDLTTKNDLTEYLNKYHGEDFYKNNTLTAKEKDQIDDVFLTSLGLKYLLEAKQSNDNEKVKIQQKVLSDLLEKYEF